MHRQSARQPPMIHRSKYLRGLGVPAAASGMSGSVLTSSGLSMLHAPWMNGFLEQTQPVGLGDHGTSQQDRNHQQDDTAANSRAAPAKTEPALEPVE
jgi:hypothetical protein